MLPSTKPAAYVTSRTTPTAAPNSGAPGAEGLYGVVKPGGPADLAGLRKGDLIVTIDNKRPGSLG
ncbi:hypothetical protein T484DRAFT_1811936 [Baffinella frigidus]|nr:hypothetical protein T484DRAFT_1811936 [Cryptophyta sp. CCMP2293]